MITLIKGNFIETKRLGELTLTPHGCVVLNDGDILGVFPEVPTCYIGAPCDDWGDRLILQGFCDLHLHAPQYPMLGLGMDLPLLDWLENYAFPTESRFLDVDYARMVCHSLAQKLIQNGTTRVCAFSSRHTDATLVLMEEFERAGICGYVGKVNMDLCNYEPLREATETSKEETLRWLDTCERFTSVRPILTPRFTLSCSMDLLSWLGALARDRCLRVQSHLSENLEEIMLVKLLHPDCKHYWQTYEKCGLLNEYTVMAHCVHSDANEQKALRDHGVYVAHCPDSNINICSGTAPIRDMLDAGVSVALGSDIAGGAQLSMLQVMTACLRASKAKRIESDWKLPFLSVEEAYYLGTTAGAEYFGGGPGFATGDALHAVVLEDTGLPPGHELTLKQRFERAVYLCEDKHIAAVYANGKRVK